VPRLPRDVPGRIAADRDDKPRARRRDGAKKLVSACRRHTRHPAHRLPLSNARLGIVEDIARHPLPELIAHGLFVTLNSDDPAYFGGYLNESYQSVAEAFGLNRETLCTLARNSFEASFLDDANKAEFFAKVDAYRINAPA
jgi:adenosine deaminase